MTGVGTALAAWRACGLLAQGALPIPGDEPERTGDLVAMVIEIAILTWLFYGGLKFLHGKAGLAVLKGVLITLIGIVLVLAALTYLVGLQFPRLQVAGTYMLPFFIVVLVVLFQPEIRRGFLRMGEAGSLGPRGLPGQISDLSMAFRALSRRQTGALVVFERQTGIKGLQDTGVPLDAALSGALLESIFYPKSPLHDGAVVVRGERIVAACCMLPLTDRTSLARELGTRHRAALGATEDSDAVAVVVSEETGRISVAHKGRLQPVADPDRLEQVLAEHLNGSLPGDDL
ncbi:MAG TPA: diadenylate cyclase [Planctomycetota bacterium]|nr:diadenylate cyclase [Planctomycetota bacterium]